MGRPHRRGDRRPRRAAYRARTARRLLRGGRVTVRPTVDLASLLRNGAQGFYAEQAAVGLLLDHGVWLCRTDFIGACVETFSSGAVIDWPAAIQRLDLGELPCS